MSYDIDILGSELSNDEQRIYPQAVEGLRKLAQRVLLLLFKEEDNPADRGFGTEIVTLKDGFSSDDEALDEAKGRVLIALTEVAEYLKRNTQIDAPDDEKIKTLEISQLERDKEVIGLVNLEILVVSQAGEYTVIKAPVKSLNEGES